MYHFPFKKEKHPKLSKICSYGISLFLAYGRNKVDLALLPSKDGDKIALL